MRMVRHAFQQLSGKSHAASTIAVLAGALTAAGLFHFALDWTAPEPPSSTLVAPAQLVTVTSSTVAVADTGSATTEKAGAVGAPPSATVLTRALQTGLRKAGCYEGPISGIWTRQSRDAMSRFVEMLNARLPVEQPAPVLLALIESSPAASCTARRQPAPSVGGREAAVPAQRIEGSIARVEPSAATPPASVETAIGTAAVTVAAVAAAGVSQREPPRLTPYPLATDPAARAEAKPARVGRAASRARVVYVYPRRYHSHYVQQRQRRTVTGNFSRSVARNFNSLKRAFSGYVSY